MGLSKLRCDQRLPCYSLPSKDLCTVQNATSLAWQSKLSKVSPMLANLSKWHPSVFYTIPVLSPYQGLCFSSLHLLFTLPSQSLGSCCYLLLQFPPSISFHLHFSFPFFLLLSPIPPRPLHPVLFAWIPISTLTSVGLTLMYAALSFFWLPMRPGQ